jgi:exosortase/archaeosortase family protein
MYRNIHSLQTLPTEVKTFLWRAVFLFIFWKSLYILVLIPNQMPDSWLVKKVGDGTAFILDYLYPKLQIHSDDITRPKIYGRDTVSATYSMINTGGGRNLLGIYQACNGLELMILYAGFIICFSGNWSRKIIFIILGVIGLFIINVLRCAFLGTIVLEMPRYFVFAHKYIFNLVVYAFTFLLWVIYVTGLNKKHDSATQTA